jgi:hypothetical protein
MVEYCVTATKFISSSLIHVYVFMLWL